MNRWILLALIASVAMSLFLFTPASADEPQPVPRASSPNIVIAPINSSDIRLRLPVYRYYWRDGNSRCSDWPNATYQGRPANIRFCWESVDTDRDGRLKACVLVIFWGTWKGIHMPMMACDVYLN